ncbi:MAG: hypothetical protein P8049_06950 [Gemmatimonadota bacterium]
MDLSFLLSGPGPLRILIAAVAILLPGALDAQQPDTDTAVIATGDRVRFVAPPRFPDRTIGTVLDVDSDRLHIDRKRSRGGPAEVRIDEIQSLEVSVAQSRQTALGLAIGTGVGLSIGGLLAWAYCDGPDNLCDFGDVALITAVVAAPFAAAGGLLGAFSFEHDWQEVSLN